jgi:hypothetical protein
MSSNFMVFKTAIARQFASMQSRQLFRVSTDKDQLWSVYLESFPEGSNPIYRQRREYDCSCCKQFVRGIGDVVAIGDGGLISIWDAEIDDHVFAVVAKAMSAAVKAQRISDIFVHYEPKIGTDRSFEQRVDGSPAQWNHFHVSLPAKAVMQKARIDGFLGERRTTQEVLLRGLRSLDIGSINTVLDLIDQNSLYRGEEHRGAVAAFKAIKLKFDALSGERDQELFAWSVVTDPSAAGVARMRNTAIGTLLIDLSEGVDIESAVKSFEVKVAPANYKRPTAVITKAMIEDARKQIDYLGLTSALDRRYAVLSDLGINNLLFVDRSARKKISGDVFDDLSASAAVKPKSFDKVEEIGIEKFITDVLPKAESIEVLFEGKHRGNLVSLIAPLDPTAGRLFKWGNGFSWAYNGDVADSIKERVKQAGGNVTGDLCCRLSWDYDDDLDFHMQEPTGSHIYFGTRGSVSSSGGMLDVDANAGGHRSMDHPVENIFYRSRSSMKEGTYHLFVNNYRRVGKDSRVGLPAEGFDVEIDYLGDVVSFHYEKALASSKSVTIAKFQYTHAGGIQIMESLPSSGGSSKLVWGVGTNAFHRAKVIMLSPNHWDGEGVGNKHYFFILDGCKNDGEARGFFNEFLDARLDKNRKVFEVVGSKMKASTGSEEQLSGLGFSSTQKSALIVKVSGSFTRTLKVVF